MGLWCGLRMCCLLAHYVAPQSFIEMHSEPKSALTLNCSIFRKNGKRMDCWPQSPWDTETSSWEWLNAVFNGLE